MIRITPDLSINPAMVASVERDNRFYANGSAFYLVITMNDGKVHRVEHGYGVDIFAIEKAIGEAVA